MGEKCEQLKYLEIKAIDTISGVSNGGGVQGNRLNDTGHVLIHFEVR